MCSHHHNGTAAQEGIILLRGASHPPHSPNIPAYIRRSLFMRPCTATRRGLQAETFKHLVCQRSLNREKNFKTVFSFFPSSALLACFCARHRIGRTWHAMCMAPCSHNWIVRQTHGTHKAFSHNNCRVKHSNYMALTWNSHGNGTWHRSTRESRVRGVTSFLPHNIALAKLF